MQYFSHETLRVPMVLPDNISVATGGQIIARTNIKYSGGSSASFVSSAVVLRGWGSQWGVTTDYIVVGELRAVSSQSSASIAV